MLLFLARAKRSARTRNPTMNLDDLSHALLKEDLVLGRGATAEAGQDVVIHYVGRLADGKQFDSSRARRAPPDDPAGASVLPAGARRAGGKSCARTRPRRDPLDFALGAGELIKGLDE